MKSVCGRTRTSKEEDLWKHWTRIVSRCFERGELPSFKTKRTASFAAVCLLSSGPRSSFLRGERARALWRQWEWQTKTHYLIPRTKLYFDHMTVPLMEDTCLCQEATRIEALTKRHAPFVAFTKCVVISSVKHECFFSLSLRYKSQTSR